MTKKLLALLTSIALVVALTACGAPAEERQSIAATAAELGDFDTLLFALGEAGLDGLFADDEAGPFTVFAPTDAAFAALPDGVLDQVLADEDLLAAFLTYHVLDGARSPVALVNAGSVPTLQSLPLCFEADGAGFAVNGDAVAAGPIQATNGTIYAVDVVLNPFDSVAGRAIFEGDYTTLVAAVTAAGLVDTLVCGGPFTVFAPTDAAFAALPAGTVEGLLEDVDALTNILLYHVVPGTLLAADVLAAVEAGGGSVDVTTAQGSAITVTAPEGVVLNGTVNVTETNILARNGVIHQIDTVLLPPAE